MWPIIIIGHIKNWEIKMISLDQIRREIGSDSLAEAILFLFCYGVISAGIIILFPLWFPLALFGYVCIYIKNLLNTFFNDE